MASNKPKQYIHFAIQYRSAFMFTTEWDLPENLSIREAFQRANEMWSYFDFSHSNEMLLIVGNDRSITKKERKRREHNYREYCRNTALNQADRDAADNGPYGRIE